MYARQGTFQDRAAIMYSWYMPKDEPSPFIGHRHDWENAVVWLDAAGTSLDGLSVSEHGGYKSTRTPALSGSRPLVKYVSHWPLDHALDLDTTVGSSQPLIAWESLTDAARQALSTTDFGDALVPFKDSDFQGYLNSSYTLLYK